MVQRKVPKKLGIQVDHVKSENRLANLKPSSCQYQDGKNSGLDMKKKMKRSRSIKLADIESLRSATALKQAISKPRKLPPLNVTTQQKQQRPVRANLYYGSPNYMKGTRSSEARKEISPVSSRRSSSDSKSKLGSGSSNKPARSLTKSSSLKLVRTLTKTLSFKHVRASSKKCSRVIFGADVNAKRATCSSTLKDSKFPDYLVLNPGGTEVEGTSVMKVCPYTHCSLNGHHHKPLQPLKHFLSERRRMLKKQKIVKLEALSPSRVKPVDEEIDAKHMNFDNKPASTEGGMSYFIEIYSNSDNVEPTHEVYNEAEVEHSYDEQIAEDLSAGSPRSEIDFEETLGQYSGITSMVVDIMEGFTEEEKVENPDEYIAIAAQIEEVHDDGSDFEVESGDNSEDDGSISEGSNMDWEEGQFPTLEIETATDDSMKINYESDFAHGCLSEINYHGLPGDPITKPKNFEDVSSGGKIGAEGIFEEESACSETLQVSDFEMDDMYQNLEILESSLVSGSDPESTTEEAETDLVGIKCTSAWTKDSAGEDYNESHDIEDSKRDQIAISEFHVEQNSQKIEAGVQMEEKDQAAITKRSIGVQVPDDLFEGYLYDGKLDDNQNYNIIEQFEDSAEDNIYSQDTVAEIFHAENQERPLEGKYYMTDIAENFNIVENNEDKDEVKKFEVTSSKDFEEESDSGMNKISLAGIGEEVKIEVAESNKSDASETFPVTGTEAIPKSNPELSTIDCKQKWTIRAKKPAINEEEMRNFNPREPNFLPAVPEPGSEKVDLQHQMMDERKNSEEWMVDYALRQAVTKLAPARKRKVALLVEAFETVIPAPKFEIGLRHSSASFAHARPMQVCRVGGHEQAP